MSANLNLSGKLPILKVLLKRFYKIGAVEREHFLKIFNEISSRVLVFFEFKVCIFIFIVSFDFSKLKTIACIYFTFYKIFRNFIIVLSIGVKEVTSF